jgi:hypothetical protein
MLVLVVLASGIGSSAVGGTTRSLAAGDRAAPMATQRGWVRTGDLPLSSLEVGLYRAGARQPAAGAVLLGSARTDRLGRFTIRYRVPPGADQVLYLVAHSGGPGPRPVELVAALDPRTVTADVVVNERTTVAAGYALAQFTDGRQVGGPHPGLRNAAATAQNLADLSSGGVGAVLAGPPNGSLTSTLRTFNSLANLLAACVRDGRSCSPLFAAAAPPRGRPPRTTFEAIVDVARNPWQRVDSLFRLAQVVTPYQPALSTGAQPEGWTLAVRYQGDGPLGQQIDGPGNLAFDVEGNAWVTNNYEFSLDPLAQVCGSDKVLKLTPTGGSAPGAPYRGGGLYGAGYGITLDPDGNVWVGNFGFQGATCPLPPPPNSRSMSVSQFAPDGTALSPPDGFRSGTLINQAQGTVSDQQGNVWVANCSGRSLTVLPAGDPQGMYAIEGIGSKPFDIAFDTRGHAWVTVNNQTASGEPPAPGAQAGAVVEVAPDGSIVGPPIGASNGIWRPMAVATDSAGNVWLSNSGILDPPCEGTLADAMVPPSDIGENGVRNVNASITLIRPTGKGRRIVTTFGKTSTDSRGGLAMPWGVAIDGNDNVWISNFHGQQLSHLCGVRVRTCPPGTRTGDPISPANGYGSDALVRNTAVEIDPSGNVWVTNNWILNAEAQTNPGGHELVVFIGMAAPVKTPLIGPPQQP